MDACMHAYTACSQSREVENANTWPRAPLSLSLPDAPLRGSYGCIARGTSQNARVMDLHPTTVHMAFASPPLAVVIVTYKYTIACRFKLGFAIANFYKKYFFLTTVVVHT